MVGPSEGFPFISFCSLTPLAVEEGNLQKAFPSVIIENLCSFSQFRSEMVT